MDPDRLSKASERSVQDSTHLIPPVDGSKKALQHKPWYMTWTVMLGTPLVILVLGIVLEAGTIISSKTQGFKVPPTNVFPLVSPQFLLSFVPSIIILPNAFMWREIDWEVRSVQPYILLWKGRSPAEESLLLDYITLGPFLGLFRAWKYKHRIVFWSAITAITTYSFQPLAGAIFQLRSQKRTDPTSVTSITDIGLIPPDVDQLNAFVAAAGFAEAAVYQGLPDPPFIDINRGRGWSTAQFAFPTDPGLNGTISVNTIGIQTATNCANPADTNLGKVPESSNLTLTSRSVEGCTVNVTYDQTVSAEQYGVVAAPCLSSPPIVNVTLQPVMFWFYHNKTDGSPDAKTIFCAPSIKASTVTASIYLNDKSLYQVNTTSDDVPSNNVTGPQLNGQAYNGVLFPDDPNPFIQARSSTIKSGIPGAIFRLASNKNSGGLQSAFDLPNEFLDSTNTVYLKYLSVIAKTVYFVQTNTTLPAETTSLVPVLVIDPFPGHLLAILLILIGSFGIVIQFLHQRERRKVLLTAPPGSIGAIVSLTSHAGFGELLYPCDNEATLQRKLSGLTFHMDKRTGAIVADDAVIYDSSNIGQDDAMLSLLRQNRSQNETMFTTASSSTDLAHQAASGYPPWKTPYDP